MTQISFVIPAVPVAQPRPRASSFGGKVRVHEVSSIVNADGTRKPHPIAAFKATARQSLKSSYDGPPLQGDLSLDLCFVMPRPQSMRWKTKPMPRVPHCVKPDLDNLVKAVLDALNALAFNDDSQISEVTMRKVVASGDEQPHVEVRININ